MSVRKAFCGLLALPVMLLAIPQALAEDKPEPVKHQGDEAFILEKGDVNTDGKPDVWIYYVEKPSEKDPSKAERFLVKKEADLDFNGKKDITRLYDDLGQVSREEADLDFDGNIDLITIQVNGLLKEKMYYKDARRVVFIHKVYDEEGKLASLERDDDGDGKTDYCELWFSGEKINKRGWDRSGDGQCDYWESAD